MEVWQDSSAFVAMFSESFGMGVLARSGGCINQNLGDINELGPSGRCHKTVVGLE
jgi:hypothetical protein